MTSTVLRLIVAVSLLCIQAGHAQCQDTGTCSTEETRRAVLNEVLAASHCDDYICGMICMIGVILMIIIGQFDACTALKNSLSDQASSCTEIFDSIPHAPSGYYWLQSANGSAVHVFCDMTLTCKGVGGGWMQVAKLDMTNSSQCPPGTRLRTDYNKTLCGINTDGPDCSSIIFGVNGTEYRQVCGKIIAYQYGSPDAFGPKGRPSANSIDGSYVDGISLTYGSNPRKHIWTFAAALDEVATFSSLNCPCTNIHHAMHATSAPEFVGHDYFCDTGSEQQWSFIFYSDNPLWDGAGCGPANTCCSLNDPPWFLKQLPSTITEDIEMRMCIDQTQQDEDVRVEIIELYVH